MKTSLVLLGLILSVSSSFAKSEKFKLYDEPRAKVSKFCDVYTQLVLNVNQDGVGQAELSNHVAGGCEIFVPANYRSYNIVGNDDGCGSIVYNQGAVDDAFAIEIVDNRKRVCENVIPALIVVTELERPMYSKDN